MIEHTLDTAHSILTVRPTCPLAQNDFTELAAAVDPCIEETAGLVGLIIDAPAFPGWENFAAMVAHFNFVRNHQKLIRMIALVTDSTIGNVAEHLASHFVSARIRHSPAGELEAAERWIMNRG